MLKHGTDQGRDFLQRAQNRPNTPLKMPGSFDSKLADLMVFQITPYELIRIQIRRVRGQEEQTKAPI
jgi:hypothetical protein